MQLADSDLDELFEQLPPSMQRLVARTGDIASVLEKYTSTAELCPRCGVRDQVPGSRHGLCSVCAEKVLTEAHELAHARELSHAEYNAAKQRLSRTRRGIVPVEPTQGRGAEYGRRTLPDTDDKRPKRHCDICETLMVDHGEELCPACADRQERREGLRACGS